MRRQKKSYQRPKRPYDKQRIEYERKILEKYGLKRKREIWRTESILRRIRRIAMELVANANKEREEILLSKLKRLGILSEDATLEDVLALNIEDILERRLQTLVYRKGLANTIKQARQFIVHGHITIDGRRIKWPSALVTLDEENKIGFYSKSKLNKSLAKIKVQEAKKEIAEIGEKVE